MIWLWRICFSALLLLPGPRLNAATVSGSVELRDSRDPGVRKKSDYSGVVVWLDPLSGSAPLAIPQRHARMVQKDKTFTPHVLAIPIGTTVDFPNFDPIFHNAFSNYNGQLFDVGLYPPGSSRSVRFSRPGIVRVFCNIHASMSAIVAVLNTLWFAVTDKNGDFAISDVPAGEYSLHVFHERATAATLDALTRRVTVHAEPVSIPKLSISESGYLAIPHANKYGRPYPPATDAGGVYPAVRP
jgi:plastocyanin